MHPDLLAGFHLKCFPAGAYHAAPGFPISGIGWPVANSYCLLPQIQVNGMFDFLLHIGVTDMEEYRNYLTHNLSEIESVSAIQTFCAGRITRDHQADLSHLLKRVMAKHMETN
jgi:hypothetical protein